MRKKKLKKIHHDHGEIYTILVRQHPRHGPVIFERYDLGYKHKGQSYRGGEIVACFKKAETEEAIKALCPWLDYEHS